MKIKITLGHIAKSTQLTKQMMEEIERKQGSALMRRTTCPLAVALLDQTGKEFAVMGDSISCGGGDIDLPADAQEFIRQADKDYNANAVNPTEFDLPI